MVGPKLRSKHKKNLNYFDVGFRVMDENRPRGFGAARPAGGGSYLASSSSSARSSASSTVARCARAWPSTYGAAFPTRKFYGAFKKQLRRLTTLRRASKTTRRWATTSLRRQGFVQLNALAVLDASSRPMWPSVAAGWRARRLGRWRGSRRRSRLTRPSRRPAPKSWLDACCAV